MKIFWSILGLIVLVLGTLTYRNFFPAEPQAPIPPTETVVAEPDSTGGSAITQKPVAAEEPVVAKPANKPAIWKKVGWWLKRHMALVAILVLAAAGVIIALLVIFRRNRRPRYRYGAKPPATATIGRGEKWVAFFRKLLGDHYLYYLLTTICFLVAAYFVPNSPVNTSMILAIMGCFFCSMARNFKDARKFINDPAKLGRYWKARLSLPILKIYAFLMIVWLSLIIGTYLKQKGAPL